MRSKWQSEGLGIESRKHPTRKHGVRFDRYFRGRYTIDGKTVTVGFGWASNGVTVADCVAMLRDFKKAKKDADKDKPTTLIEKRQIDIREKEAKKLADVTWEVLFAEHYLPQAKVDKPKSWVDDEYQHRLWINPVIGSKRLADISPFHIEQVKKRLFDAGRADRTVEYVLATIRHCFNFAIKRGLFDGTNPVSAVKKPRPNNQRVRFLTEEEAASLLARLAERSHQTWQISTVSLYSGLRFGEIAGLRWQDLDLAAGSIFVADPKNQHSRTVYMPEQLLRMFSAMERGGPADLVFPDRKGRRMVEPSNIYSRTVEDLGLNAGITDRRQRVVFHTLRHTFASWLAMRGVQPLTLKNMLGHRTLAMTERYSHLAPGNLKAATRLLDRPPANVVPITREREA